MARPTREERLRDVHQQGLARFDVIWSAVSDERTQCLQDRRFYSIPGAQWEGYEQQFENKPRFEINKIHLAVIRIFNEYRNNRIDVSFTSKDGATDDKLADTCSALYRSDEQDSSAEESYDNAFDEAVGGGFGAWRLRACYADEDDEDGEDDQDEARPQRIRFEPIYDADSSVYFDLNAKKQDKSDARHCFVVSSMTREEYERKYDEDTSSWPSCLGRSGFDWAPPDLIRVAEYYCVEIEPVTLLEFRGIDGEEVEHAEADLEDDEDLARTLDATGFKLVGQRDVKRRRIRKYLLNGMRVIKDCKYVAGRQIPVVPVYGKFWQVDGIERCMGHVRLAKDAQRILNMTLSKIGEISALSPIEKPYVSPEQIKGHEHTWSDDNIKNRAYRLINLLKDEATGQTMPTQGPLGVAKPPDIPPATVALAQIGDSSLRDIIGNPDQAEKMVSHVAGKTVELLQQRIDGNAFIYISNMAKAIRRCGQIWLSMARELYTEPKRKMKGVGVRGELSQFELVKPVIGSDGKVAYDNDLSRAAFDVAVDIGPSSASKRQGAVRAATGMMAVMPDPQTQQVLANFALMNMEGEGVEGIRKWSRQKLVNDGVLDPTPEEARKLAAAQQGAQPSANDQYAIAAAEEAKAKAQQAIADTALIAARTEKTKADTDKTKADTIETLAGVDLDRRKAAVDAAQRLHGMLTQPDPQPASGPGVNSNV